MGLANGPIFNQRGVISGSFRRLPRVPEGPDRAENRGEVHKALNPL